MLRDLVFEPPLLPVRVSLTTAPRLLQQVTRMI
jgi:hypothetical protein